MQVTNLLKETITYGKPNSSRLDFNKSLNIAYGIDNNFVFPMGISMTSIITHNEHLNLIFHVFTDFIDNASKNLLKQLTLKYKIIIQIYIIDSNIFKNLPHTNHFSQAMYNRFIMPQILKDNIKNYIYIDADIQCFNKLDTLLDLKLDTNIAAVVSDLPYVKEQQIPFLQLKHNNYFNSGFIYINIEKWITEKITEKSLQISFDNLGKLKWQDQDALNIALDGKCLYLDKKYDYLLNMKHKSSTIPDDVIFVHYVGRYKPWTEWCLHPLKEKFLAVARNSLWKNVPLTKPTTYKTMKMMGRSCILYGKYLQGLYWYLKYCFYKLKSKI